MSFDFSVGIAQRTPHGFITKTNRKGRNIALSCLDIPFTVKLDAFCQRLLQMRFEWRMDFQLFSLAGCTNWMFAACKTGAQSQIALYKHQSGDHHNDHPTRLDAPCTECVLGFGAYAQSQDSLELTSLQQTSQEYGIGFPTAYRLGSRALCC